MDFKHSERQLLPSVIEAEAVPLTYLLKPEEQETLECLLILSPRVLVIVWRGQKTPSQRPCS